MKKIVLFLVLFVLVSIGSAKQLAICYGDSSTRVNCSKQTKTGQYGIKNIDTLGGMYSKGWRLIEVSVEAYEKNGDRYISLNTAYYLEK